MEISLLEKTIKEHIDGYFKDDYTLLESDKLNASFFLCINGLVCNGFNSSFWIFISNFIFIYKVPSTRIN